MATPATLPNTPAADGSKKLSQFHTSMGHAAGTNLMITDIANAWDALGSTAVAASLLGYVRLHDGVNKGLFVPMSAVCGYHPLYNCGFALWPYATTFTSVADGTYTAEGWRYGKVGVMVHDISRSTDVPSVAALYPMQNYSILVDCTTVDASIAATDFCFIEHRVEGTFWQQFLAQRAWTIGFWHKHTKVGTYCVALVNSGSDRSFVTTYTQAVTDTWEYAVVSFLASPTAGTWNYTTGVGARLIFAITAGSNFQVAAGAWQSSLSFATSAQVNACDSTANNFRLAAIQPVVGTVAIPFTPRPHNLDELLAERYRKVFGGNSANEVIANGSSNGTTQSFFPVFTRVPMRVTPTAIRVSAQADFQVINGGAAAFAIPGAGGGISLNSTYSGVNSVFLTATHVTIAGAANDALVLAAQNTNARLALEALL